MKSVRFDESGEGFEGYLKAPREHIYIYCPLALRGGHLCDEVETCRRKVKLLWREYEYQVLSVEGHVAQKWWVMEDGRGRRIDEKMVWMDRGGSGASTTVAGLPLVKYGNSDMEPEIVFSGDLKCIGRGI